MEEKLLEQDREEERGSRGDISAAAVIGGLLIGSQIW